MSVSGTNAIRFCSSPDKKAKPPVCSVKVAHTARFQPAVVSQAHWWSWAPDKEAKMDGGATPLRMATIANADRAL